MARARGVLRPTQGERRFDHRRLAPAPALRGTIEHYWSVTWALPEPYVSEVLPHPSAHLVLERGASRLVGVPRGRFTRRLEGEGRVFGIKLRPAMIYSFVRRPVAALNGRTAPLAELFGGAAARLEEAILAEGPDAGPAIADAFLEARLPAPEESALLARDIVERIRDDRTLLRVEDVAAGEAKSVRSLQRLFRKHVGPSPKWVIRRYRLHEAAERLAESDAPSWTALAYELGYADQSHFIRDFKAVVGVPPAEYARQCRAPAP